MIPYTLTRQQLLGTTLEEAWRFFTDPYNLARITPPWLGFEVTDAPAVPVHPGAIITYRIRPLGPLPVHWTTEITQFEKPRLFVDEQRFGPYRFWHHLHRFEAAEGGVHMSDLVHYRLYGGPLSRPLNRNLVRPRLEAIFTYRHQVLGDLFPHPGAEDL